ncbi:MAG: hypothetical protein QM736_25625 [Vicinamibacterales bacterium]
MDATTFVVAGVVLTAVSIMAGTAPALLAAHTDPAQTLRQE